MFIPKGTDAIKISYKEFCCRSKMALSSTSHKSELSRFPCCSLMFSFPLCVRFRKKSSTSAVPNMTWLPVLCQSPSNNNKKISCVLFTTAEFCTDQAVKLCQDFRKLKQQKEYLLLERWTLHAFRFPHGMHIERGRPSEGLLLGFGRLTRMCP